MIFPNTFDTVYAVGATGFWLTNGAYAENERARLLLLSVDPARAMRANLKAMRDLNDGLRFRTCIHTSRQAGSQLTA